MVPEENLIAKGLLMSRNPAQARSPSERLEDLEDLLDLRAAVKRNGRKPSVSFETVKMDRGLE